MRLEVPAGPLGPVHSCPGRNQRCQTAFSDPGVGVLLAPVPAEWDLLAGEGGPSCPRAGAEESRRRKGLGGQSGGRVTSVHAGLFTADTATPTAELLSVPLSRARAAACPPPPGSPPSFPSHPAFRKGGDSISKPSLPASLFFSPPDPALSSASQNGLPAVDVAGSAFPPRLSSKICPSLGPLTLLPSQQIFSFAGHAYLGGMC